MKKTTAFARRRARHGLPTDPSLLLNTHYSKWAMTMAAHKPMDSAEHEGTVRHIMLKAHSHLDLMMRGQVPGRDTESHDYLTHCVGVAQIRAVDIGGDGANDVIQDLNEAAMALRRARDRWERIGKWGLDGPGLQALPVAVHHYEAILRASSPQQMEHAQTVRLDQLKGKMK